MLLMVCGLGVSGEPAHVRASVSLCCQQPATAATAPGTRTAATCVTHGPGTAAFPPGSAFQGLETKGNKNLYLLTHFPEISREDEEKKNRVSV